MKRYLISVVCSDATTFSTQLLFKTRKEANSFCDGISFVLKKQGKTIFAETIRLSKY